MALSESTSSLAAAWRDARTEYAAWLTVITCLASSASLISLLQRWFNVGLFGVLADAVFYYRKIAHLLLAPLLAVLPVHPPIWYQDAYILSLIFLSLLIKVTHRFAIEQLQQHARWSASHKYPDKFAMISDVNPIFWVAFAVAPFISLFLVGLIIPPAAVALFSMYLDESLYTKARMPLDAVVRLEPTVLWWCSYFFFCTAIMLTSAIVFFALNSLL